MQVLHQDNKQITNLRKVQKCHVTETLIIKIENVKYFYMTTIGPYMGYVHNEFSTLKYDNVKNTYT